MSSVTVQSAEQMLWQALYCRGGARLDAEIWLAVAVANAVIFWFFVRYLLRLADPAKRESLHFAAVFFSVAALFIGAFSFIMLADGYFTWPRSGRRVFACTSPHEFWSFMAVCNLCVTGCLAFVAMCVIRLRRPYRKFSDWVQ